MKGNKLNVVSPNRAKHRDEMFDLISKVFSSPGYYNFLRDCREGYIDHSHYDWEASKVGFLGDQMVTHYGVWGYGMRIGGATVRVGGIGAVATHGEYRGKGLMAQTIPHSLNAMRDLRYDMTILFGIRNFYHKFGYCRAWSDTHYTVRVAELPDDKPRCRARPLDIRQTSEICRLYNRYDAGLTGTAKRPTYDGVAWQKRWTGWRWNDAPGKLAGWVLIEPRDDRLECIEAIGDVQQLMRVLGMLGRKQGVRTVRLVHFHADDPLVKTLKRGNVTAETNYHKSGGAMVRMLNLRACLGKMTGEFSRLLKDSCMEGWKGRLLIADKREKVALDIGRGKVKLGAAGASKHAIKGGEEIVQLLLGTDEPEEIVDAAGIRLTGDAKRLLSVLFPNRRPALRPWDRY